MQSKFPDCENTFQNCVKFGTEIFQTNYPNLGLKLHAKTFPLI